MLSGVGIDALRILKGKAGSAMDRLHQNPRLCFFATVAVTLVGVILRTAAMFLCFDADIGYFDAGILPVLSHVLYYVAVIAAIACAFWIPKNTLPTEWHIPRRNLVAWPLGCVMALFTVLLFITANAELFTSDGIYKTALTLLGLLGSSYFFLSASRAGRYPDWLSAVGFLPIFWCMAAVAETYLDPYVTMNSPIKIGLQMGFLGFMLIMVSELRFRLGKPAPRVAVALMGIGVFLTFNASIPVLAAGGILHHALYALYAAVLLFAGIYAAYILFCYTGTAADLPNEGAAPPEIDPEIGHNAEADALTPETTDGSGDA